MVDRLANGIVAPLLVGESMVVCAATHEARFYCLCDPTASTSCARSPSCPETNARPCGERLLPHFEDASLDPTRDRGFIMPAAGGTPIDLSRDRLRPHNTALRSVAA